MQTKELKCKIAGAGAWGSYFDSWESLTMLLQGADIEEPKNKGPKPDVIPANERRRAPLPVRLAVESSWQATQNAGIAADSLSCVFVSGLGDTDLTDYLCKTLASAQKELSPTKFHNSVHNAPAGYWTISTKTMKAANSVAGFEESVSLTLLEAIIQCNSENVPILMTFYDAPVSEVLQPLLANREPFAFSLIICPCEFDIEGPTLRASVAERQASTGWPVLKNEKSYLTSLYNDNPSARILCIAELLCDSHTEKTSLTLPLSKGTSITLSCVKDNHELLRN